MPLDYSKAYDVDAYLDALEVPDHCQSCGRKRKPENLRDTGTADEAQPCPDCGCLPGERASGDDGDGVWYQAWACTCGCHDQAWAGED